MLKKIDLPIILKAPMKTFAVEINYSKEVGNKLYPFISIFMLDIFMYFSEKLKTRNEQLFLIVV